MSSKSHAGEVRRLIRLWNLRPDGEPFDTASSTLVPAQRNGNAVIIKLARHPEEARGNRLMAWWDGRGAAPVIAADGDAILMPRAASVSDLARMSRGDRDEVATRILCAAADRLHALPLIGAPADLVPLARWFADLQPVAPRNDFFAQAWAAAERLLQTQNDEVVLHGDIHHGNLLHFGDLGWRAVDPKGLIGARAFDYANLFCNPDADTAHRTFDRRLAIVAAAAELERQWLSRWIAAWCGLSATWLAADGADPSLPVGIGRRALAAAGA